MSKRLAALLLPALAAALLVSCAGNPAVQVPKDSAVVLPEATSAAWLDRLGWGVSTHDWRTLQAQGRDRWLDGQLKPRADDGLPSAVAQQIAGMTIEREALPSLVRDLEQRRKAADAVTDDMQRQAAREAWQQQMNALAREAASRELLLALYSEHGLREQLAWFWLNHFSVHRDKGQLRAMVGDYDAQLRAHALGRFRELLEVSVFHPAMLQYLDNVQNAAGHVNENYARELLELHTLGVDGGYTQQDVQELARVLTGLGVRVETDAPKLKPAQQALYWRDGLTEFNPARHDMGDKHLLGATVHAGGGVREVEQVLDRLARHPSTARFICRKLARYFVADEPPAALVQRMSDRFLQTDGQIAEVMRVLVASPEFQASLGRKFKDPMHYVVSSLRLAYDRKPVQNVGPILGWLNRLGEMPFGRQTPDGYPLDESAWSAPGQMNARFEIARSLGGGSAGLFKPEGLNATEQPAFPQLANPAYYEALEPRLSSSTHEALAQARSPQEWSALLLASPEFMRR
jgi:uncharacterized protein (DUF1800 family)